MFSRPALKLTMALFIFATMMLTACGGGESGGSSATLTGLSITPATASVAKGQNSLFTATAHYSDGSSANVTSQVTWSSTNAAVATVNSTTGVATGLSVGSTSISATFNGVSSTATPLTVTAAVVTNITVSTTSYTVPKGSAATFTAMATYSDGTSGDVSGSVTWSASDTSVATLNGSGIASTLAEGNSEISASGYNLTSNSVVMTVTAPALVSIALNPSSASVTKGEITRFTATGTYSDNTTADITSQVSWHSNDSSIATFVATVNAYSLVALGLSEGTTTVNATLGKITSPDATLTVTAAIISDVTSITGITITPNYPSVAKGVSVTFTALATYSDGTSADVSGSVTWKSSDETVATISNTGIASTLAIGTSDITASGYGLASNTTTILVSGPVLASLTITPASATVQANTTQKFVASGTLTDGTAANIVFLRSLTWGSSDTAVATINSTGSATTLATGSTNITVSNGTIISNSAVLAVTPAAP